MDWEIMFIIVSCGWELFWGRNWREHEILSIFWPTHNFAWFQLLRDHFDFMLAYEVGSVVWNGKLLKLIAFLFPKYISIHYSCFNLDSEDDDPWWHKLFLPTIIARWWNNENQEAIDLKHMTWRRNSLDLLSKLLRFAFIYFQPSIN